MYGVRGTRLTHRLGIPDTGDHVGNRGRDRHMSAAGIPVSFIVLVSADSPGGFAESLEENG
jgi:hypothetical protein